MGVECPDLFTKEAWSREIEPIPNLVCPEPDEILHRGELVNPKQPRTTKGRIVVIGFTIFVDDTAFVFNSRAALERALPFLQRQFARFGLLMHFGTVDPTAKTKKKRLHPSKTECMWFPARPVKLTPADKAGKTPDEIRAMKKEITKSMVAERIFWGDNSEFHVHYTDCFKYLGSRLVSTLSDEPEIRHKIRQATAQMHSLTNFWRSRADLQSKRFIYLAIHINTLLFGCEYWALTDLTRGLLSGFHHKSIRKILKIGMQNVKDDHIKNEHIRNRLCVDDIHEIMLSRQANFIGRIARLPQDRLPRQIIGSWLPTARKVGAPDATTARTMHSTLTSILRLDETTLTGNDRTEWSRYGALSAWVPMAEDRHYWKHLIQDHLALVRRRTWQHDTHTLGPPVLKDWGLAPADTETIHI